MAMPLVEKRVANGIKLLDERYPGWRDEIDLEALDMSDCAQCILGQLVGHFGAGLLEIFGKVSVQSEAIDHYGFDVNEQLFKYEDLDQAWREALTKEAA